MERLGRLLSASASIFSSKVDEDPETKETSEISQSKFIDTNIPSNTSEDMMSTSDTSSHLWQGISGNEIMIYKSNWNSTLLFISPIVQKCENGTLV